MNAIFILALISLLFAVASFLRPNWPLIPVAVILLSIIALIGGR